MFKARKHTLIAALAVIAAVAPSTASARYLTNDPVSGPAVGAQSAAPIVHQPQAGPSASGTFDWADAGVGAAATLALVGGGALVLGGTRRRGHTARAS